MHGAGALTNAEIVVTIERHRDNRSRCDLCSDVNGTGAFRGTLVTVVVIARESLAVQRQTFGHVLNLRVHTVLRVAAANKAT